MQKIYKLTTSAEGISYITLSIADEQARKEFEQRRSDNLNDLFKVA